MVKEVSMEITANSRWKSSEGITLLLVYCQTELVRGEHLMDVIMKVDDDYMSMLTTESAWLESMEPIPCD